ncbi:MAG: hypothetical protein P1U89_22900 [Verrucomicrobiales bacterium]|nr:hypothetical protein [Verrucomicrobiales bacterium]
MNALRWWFRWVRYFLIGVALIYLVEDFRGALAWKRYLAGRPDFKSLRPVAPQKSPGAPREMPDELAFYADGSRFIPLDQSRTERYRGYQRELEFPLVPFRRCGRWNPESIFKEWSDSENPAKALLSGPGAFEVDALKGNAQAIFYARCLIWRALAFQNLEMTEASVDSLQKAIRIIQDFDNGASLIRSNDVAIDWMNVLQLIWELVESGKLSSGQVTECITLLEAARFGENAEKSADRHALDICRELNELKWSLRKRAKQMSRLPDFTEWDQWFQVFSRNAYILLAPNGWVDQNKINVCRALELPESRPIEVGFDPYRSLPVDLIHRFDPRPAEAFMRCALVALKAELFKVENGRYPDSVDGVFDLFNSGKTLIYRLEKSRPVIYSIGPNLRDDGGIPRAPVEEGDLVWRYQLPDGFTFDDYILY